MKTKKVVFRKPREVVIEEAELPEPSENQILIKTLATLISTGTELTILLGEFPSSSYWDKYGQYPFTAGYSNVGLVLKKGNNVREIEVGDRVASMAPHSQYALVDVQEPVKLPREAIKIPEGISDEGATFHLLASIVMNGVRLANVRMGECVVVVGAGLLGQLAIMFSRLMGGYPVVAVDLSEKRIKIAQESGATETVKSDVEDVEEKIRSFTEGRMADVVFEVTGSPKVIPWAIKLVKHQGRFVVLSSPRGPTQLDFHDEVNAPSRVIIGAHGTSQPEYETLYNQWTARRNTKLFFEFLKAGIVKINHLISHKYPWFEAKKAYEMLAENRTEAMGVILDYKGERESKV